MPNPRKPTKPKAEPFRHTPRELGVLNRAHSAMMVNVNAGRRYDVLRREWVDAEVPTQVEIITAAAEQGIEIPVGHVLLNHVQTSYRRVKERGGIDKIAQDIEARIEAARQRLAAKAA